MLGKVQLLENMPKINCPELLTNSSECQTITPDMASTTKGVPRMTIRPQADEHKLVKMLQKRLGLKPGQIARLAIRRLAEAEGLKAS